MSVVKKMSKFIYFLSIIFLIIWFILLPAKEIYAQSSDSSDNSDDSNSNNTEEEQNTNSETDEEDNDLEEENDDNKDYYEVYLPDLIINDSIIGIEGEEETSIYTPPKDPFLASILSFMWIGLGQTYVGENPFYSTLLVSTEFLFLVGGVSIFFILQAQYSTYDDPLVRWAEFSGESKILVVTGVLSYVALKILNVLDSYNQAVRYNRKYFRVIADSSSVNSNNEVYPYVISFNFTFNSIGFNIKF